MPQPSPSSLLRRLPLPSTVLAMLAAAAWLVASAAVTSAAAPHIVGGITDQVGALDACRQEVISAQRALFDRTGTQLYAVFVDSTDGVDMSDYVNQLLDGSNGQVTEQDALLAVATGDRDYQLYTGETLKGKIGASEQDSLVETYILPALKSSDWCAAAIGATVAVSTGLGVTTDTGDTTDTGNPGDTGNGGGTGGGGISMWLIVLIVLVVLGGIGFWFLRGRANLAVYKERATQEDLGKQASALLIATDDALRSADQEVGFTQAQFGDAQAAPFQKALDDAKAELRQAFVISQQLDDHTPETPDQRHSMLQEIIDRCTRAQGMVNDQMARIKTLRDLSKNVDQVLPETASAVDAQVARIAPARAILGTLGSTFAAENIAPVAGNPDAAGVKLDAARAATAAASTSLAANDREAAVAKVQEAETAITAATALLDAVDATQAALAQSEAQLAASIAAVKQDITQAHAALSAGKGTDRAADVERAATLLAQAQQLAGTTPLDVVGATRAVTEANAIIDTVLAGVQAADQAIQRNTAAAQAAYANASASVAQANALIAANGASAAGRQAATRVAQAQQYLARAQSLMSTDPATAAQAAQTADALADEAIAEMQASTTYTGGGYGGGYTPPSSGGGLESFLGALLGGMLSGGGGGRNSGWSGGSGGFGGFGSGGFGSSGGYSGGGGRSSGGSSSSGGGHSGRRSGGGF